MLVIKQLSFAALFCLTTLALAEEQGMSRKQQCAEYGVYQDSNENWIDCADEGYVEEPYVEESYEEDVYVEEPYVEESYEEDPYVEEVYIEESYTDDL
ncbi:MAG TPA: hypothetical protein DIC30_02505 [Oceanospirillales bacterium]|jgi:hypothetical protein|nr:hypothetical protein [Oceanospirillales bacterium]|tara:strand:+ start:1837 stop:2130 length:294 start_codon:yes stop_codon:yes gene_type:complete